MNPARVLPAATPRMLAYVRMVICAILLTSVCWEDVPSIAHLPASLRQPLGVLALVEMATGGALPWLCRTEWALAVLQGATAAALALALLGWRTRVTVPAGALLYLLTTGLIREYTSFYHTGLVPLYVLGVLAFTPCGEAWSLDRARRRRAGTAVVPDDEPRAIEAWSVYAAWLVVAAHYVMAGLHKLRAGADWFHPHNFRGILLLDARQPMEFPFDFTAQILALPGWALTGLAVGAVVTELAMGAVLFSARARWLVPVLMAGVHIGIWLVQRVLFFDLILIQLIFLPPPRWFARPGAEETARAWTVRWPRAILGLGAGLLLLWVTRVEWYPLSSMPMYTDVDTGGAIRYPEIVAHLASGATEPARPEDGIGALRDSRYRRLLSASKNLADPAVAREFFAACGRRLNERRPPERRITAFEVRWRRWDFARDPHAADFGKITKRIRFDLTDPPLTPYSDSSRRRSAE